MSFSEQLKLYRLKMNYTQKQIADLLGVTNSGYGNYETGISQPNIEKIRQLANILNISSDILLETKFAEPSVQDKDKELLVIFGKETQKEKELIAMFRKLDEKAQDDILEYTNYRNRRNKTTPPR